MKDGWVNAGDHGAAGSTFQTSAQSTAGSNRLRVADTGDFVAGQGIVLSGGNVRFVEAHSYEPDQPFRSEPVTDELELRGFHNQPVDWRTFVLDIETADPLRFRWSNDLANTWTAGVSVTGDWQALSDGVEIRFRKRDWQVGHLVTFHARSDLVTEIVGVEGNPLVLKDAPNATVANASVRHHDGAALSRALETAIREKHNLFIPNGWYRLAGGFSTAGASIEIAGESGEHTVLDISEGLGAVFSLQGGKEVTIRNMRLLGHSGYKQAPIQFTRSNRSNFWTMLLKPCRAVIISGTERTWIENVHASRMSCECFYARGPTRTGRPGRPPEEPAAYQKSLTFYRCSVTDCFFNAFNNNDMGENTSVLHCRIDGAYNPWEGPGRFFRFIGNYIRNTTYGGLFGNMCHRYEHLEYLGCGQQIIADNIYEGGTSVQGIWVRHAVTQMVVRNNLFINFGGRTAINVSGGAGSHYLPARQVTVTGNIIDLTNDGQRALRRTGIWITACDTIVSDNQIYVRGPCDAGVTGIRIQEGAVNVNVHDNLIRNCGLGIITHRVRAAVAEVVDDRTFLKDGADVASEWWQSHRYRGRHVVWSGRPSPHHRSVIADFDPDTCRFTLKEPHDLRIGDGFEVFPEAANWDIHNNTITDCARPVVLDSYGSGSSLFRNNIITRGEAAHVERALVVAGRFNIIGNTITGFDEPQSVAMFLEPDRRLKTACPNIIQGNVFERCLCAVQEQKKGLLRSAVVQGNLFIECASAPSNHRQSTRKELSLPVFAPAKKPVWRAPLLTPPVILDGDVTKWPWKDPKRIIRMERELDGCPVESWRGMACAGRDAGDLILAARFSVPDGTRLQRGIDWCKGDGVAIAFRNADLKRRSPVFLFWGSYDGTFRIGPYGDLSDGQRRSVERSLVYRTRSRKDGWDCEVRIPLSAPELELSPVKALHLNISMLNMAEGPWVTWVPTGEWVNYGYPPCDVDRAGRLVLE